ncbi:MAG: 3'-5' exonuclease [Deltaproteobacteria bacterium]|nr:3'-5' exonuclease [Deltaproteobacteria bacterium]MBI3293867.1 3'-5' exonuclease [Deltaproteobacteria bacterium]
MQLSLELDEFVVFDLETTGLSPWGGDEIIEIGAIKVFGAEIDEKNAFHSLVNPKRMIPSAATNVNGITNDMVAGAPAIDEVLPRFWEFVGQSWLVAQNAKFDLGFLMKYLVQRKMKKQFEVYDTVILSRRAFPTEQGHNLDKIAGRLGLRYEQNDRHRSMGDVKLTAQAFIHLKEMLGPSIPPREKWAV